MPHYEATISLTHISTSTKARSGRSVAGAIGAAKANLRYITRSDAAEPGNVIARSNGAFLDGSPADLKAAAREAIEARSKRHTEAYGVRLADKLIVSLPNDATISEQREMCTAILTDFTADSEAFGLAAIHTDKAGNNHAHFFFVDGLESAAAAKARRPDAKRIRRADALRLNEGGNRQEVRARIAASINAVGQRAGRRRAEVRSFKDRGIERTPQQHEGPQVADKIARGLPQERITSRLAKRLRMNLRLMAKRLTGEAIEGSSIDLDDLSPRHLTGNLGQRIRGWARSVNAQRTKGQDVTIMTAIDEGCAAFVADWPQQQPQRPPMKEREEVLDGLSSPRSYLAGVKKARSQQEEATREARRYIEWSDEGYSKQNLRPPRKIRQRQRER